MPGTISQRVVGRLGPHLQWERKGGRNHFTARGGQLDISMNKILTALAAVALLSPLGCVRPLATGPLFTQMPDFDPSKALVVVYFPTSIYNGVTQGIVINGKLEKRLDYGGYDTILLPPESATFYLHGSWGRDDVISLQTLPGRTYFIRVKEDRRYKGSFFSLEVVQETDALPEITKCRAMASPNEDDCAGLKAPLIACQRTPK